jgi:hypothetical protein
MKIFKNEKMIKRNATIGSIITIASLAILGGGMYITFSKPELIFISIIALVVGFVLSQIGIYYTTRWGRKPRPDQLLDQALKGLDKKYSIYHYSTPTAHLLVGPAGVWTLFPKHQRGTITYEKNRWRQKGGGLLQGYLRLFAQEGIGRPDLEIESDFARLDKFFKKKFPEMEPVKINAALVFFHPDVVLNVDDAPTPTLFSKKLKEFIRQRSKDETLSPEVYKTIQEKLEP